MAGRAARAGHGTAVLRSYADLSSAEQLPKLRGSLLAPLLSTLPGAWTAEPISPPDPSVLPPASPVGFRRNCTFPGENPGQGKQCTNETKLPARGRNSI